MQLSRNVVLALVTIVLLLTSAGITSFSLYLPFIEAEFGWSRSEVTAPYMVAMVAWGLSAPVFGKLADDYGTRPLMLGGTVLMACSFLGMGLAQDLLQLCLAFGVGVGTAMGAVSLTVGALLISKHFGSTTRARAVSVVQTAAPLNPLLVGPLLFLLIMNFDWRTAALVTSALLWLVALPLAWLGAREPATTQHASRPRASWSACLPYLRDRWMIGMFVARLSCGLAFFQIVHLVALTLAKGYEPASGATAVSVFGGSAVASALLFGWLADRYGRARMLALSYAVRGVGTIALALSVPNEVLFYLLVALAVGPTFGTIAVQNVLFYEAVGPRLAGVIMGLSFIVHQVGSAVGPQLGSLVYDLTRTYDVYQAMLGLVLLASAAIIVNLKDVSTGPPERAATARLAGA